MMIRQKKYLLWGLIIAMGAFFAWLFVFSPTAQEEKTAELKIPKSLGGLSRTQLITGPEASQAISKLHQTGIPISAGYLANYQGGGKQISLWLSVSASPAAGKYLFEQMDVKMPKSKVFLNRQELVIKQQRVITVLGMGQQHYYWQQGAKNYWLAIDGLPGVSVVKELMATQEGKSW